MGKFHLNVLAAAIGAALIGGAAAPAGAVFPTLQPGFKALYTYTDVRTVSGSISAMLICTNIASNPISVRWDVLDDDGAVLDSDTFDTPIPAGETRMAGMSAGGNDTPAFYGTQDEPTNLASDVQGGSVRVSTFLGQRVICDLQVLDIDDPKPSFVYLPRQFTGAGKR